MEDAEAYQTPQHHTSRCYQQRNSMLHCFQCIMEDKIDQEATRHQDQAVYYQNTPVRKRVLREIPV